MSETDFPLNKDSLCFSEKKIVEATNSRTPFKNNTPGKWFRSEMRSKHANLTVKWVEYTKLLRTLPPK